MGDRGRRYATKACEACRKRKDKCDGRTRCKNCDRRGIDCVYGNPRRKRGLPQGYTKLLERRLRQLEDFIRTSTALSPIPPSEFEMILQGMEESECSEDLQMYLSRLVTTTESQGRNDASQCAGARLPSPPSSAIDVMSPGDEKLVEPTGLVSVNENSVISYVGATSGIHLVTQCEKIDTEVWRVDSLLHSRQPHTQKWATDRDVDDFISLLPPVHIQRNVFDKFFADTNPYLMFLSRDLVEDISTCLMEPSSLDLHVLRLPHASTSHRKKERAALLLFTVLATGASHLEQPITGLDEADRYKLLAMELLAQLGDHLTLECVQALLLMTWKEEGCNHSEQAWLHLGHAIRVAFHLGLNRSCENWIFLDDAERRVRDQCWWGCFVADSVVSLRLGRSPTIHEDDFDVPVPSLSVSDDMGERVLVEVVRLAGVINRINRRLYGVKRKSLEAIRERDGFNAELIAWQTQLPDDLQLPSNSICPYHAVLTMHLLFHTTLLILHRPFVSRACGFSKEIYRSSALASSFILASFRYTNNGVQSNPFIIFHTFTSAVALKHFAQSAERSIAEPAKFGFEECLAAFRAIERTWVAATNALNLLAHVFSLGNVITHSRHYNIKADDAMRWTDLEDEHANERDRLTDSNEFVSTILCPLFGVSDDVLTEKDMEELSGRMEKTSSLGWLELGWLEPDDD